MARKLYWTILALVVCSALAFAAAPLFAFRALAAAARDGDAQALAELIDYGAVRASLRPQLAAQARSAAPPAPDIWSDPIGAVRRAIEPLQAPPPAVERYVAPEGLCMTSLAAMSQARRRRLGLGARRVCPACATGGPTGCGSLRIRQRRPKLRQ